MAAASYGCDRGPVQFPRQTSASAPAAGVTMALRPDVFQCPSHADNWVSEALGMQFSAVI